MSVSDEDEVLKAESEEEDEGKEKEISGQEDKVNKSVLCVLFYIILIPFIVLFIILTYTILT